MTVKQGLLAVWVAFSSGYLNAAPEHKASTASPQQQSAVTGKATASFLTQLQPLALVDQNGDAFDAQSLQGRTLLFNFVFTHCNATCPMQTKALAEVMQALPDGIRKDVTFVSVSIDPENDSPGQLKKFAQRFNADLGNWLFLTGEAKHIKTLTDNLLVLSQADTAAAGQTIVHTASLWLVDKNGRMLQRYRGDPPDQKRLIRELQQVTQLAKVNTPEKSS